jgi:hypothetical protein
MTVITVKPTVSSTHGAHNMTERQKDLLLAALMYRVLPEGRAHLMREVPDAYNAWCGGTVVQVVRASDGKVIE